MDDVLIRPPSIRGIEFAFAAHDEGLLIVGHGTRDAAGVAQFLHAGREVADLCPDVAGRALFSWSWRNPASPRESTARLPGERGG